jgi:hypothetical protein
MDPFDTTHGPAPLGGGKFGVRRTSASGEWTDTVNRLAVQVSAFGGRVRARGAAESNDWMEAVGRRLEQAGGYVERRGLDGLRRDAERTIVDRPLVALIAAAVVGYGAARLVRR